MLARRWRLSSKASHRGSGVGNGGVRALVGPCLKELVVMSDVLWQMTTYPEQLERVEALARNDRHHLHLAQKGHLGRRQAWLQR